MVTGIDIAPNSVAYGCLDQGPDAITRIESDLESIVHQWAGIDDRRASEAVTGLARRIAVEVDPASPIIVAVPASMGPRGRWAIATGCNRAGLGVSVADIVGRPIVALAADPPARCDDNRLAILVLDDEHHLSAVVSQPSSRTILAQTPLTASPEDRPAAVRARVVDLVESSLPPGSHREVDVLTWDKIQSEVATILLVGDHQAGSAMTAMWGELFPSAERIVNPVKPILDGLATIGELGEWRCSWPTGVIEYSGQTVRGPGPVLDIEDVPLDTNERPTLHFTDPAGVPFPVVAGSVAAEGIALGPDLASGSRARLLADGRLLVLADRGIRPLSLQLGWPVPASGASSMRLATVGRRSAELLNPKVSRRRPTTVPS